MLDSLLRLVQKLRDRAEKHANILGESEMLTQYVLIDPSLRELGWDTEDPRPSPSGIPFRSRLCGLCFAS